MLERIWTGVKSHSKKLVVAGVGVVGSAAALVPSAHAALSTEQAAVVTAVETLITDLEAAGWGILLAVVTAFLGFKLFKKFLGRAT
jgi:hypothetical protein